MTTLDPATGQPLPADAIQRIVYIAPKVHVYAVPPLTSNKGYAAAQWTTRDAIFTARLRVLETAVPVKDSSASSFTSASTAATTSAPPASTSTSTSSTTARQTRAPPPPPPRLTTGPRTAPPPLPPQSSTLDERVTITLLLEDPTTGALFAAAPYTHPSTVSPCTDSSRFFAVRVVGDGGRKATLGIGFEERSDAFDFGVAMIDAGRVLGLEVGLGGGGQGGRGTGGGGAVGKGQQGQQQQKQADFKRDYSLKEGEKITVNIGNKHSRAPHNGKAGSRGGDGEPASPALFTIQPPPADGGMPFLPPPPSAADVRRGMKGEGAKVVEPTAEEMGFDDGEFGEFQ